MQCKVKGLKVNNVVKYFLCNRKYLPGIQNQQSEMANSPYEKRTSKRNHLVAFIILELIFVLMNTTAMISYRDFTLTLHSSARAATLAEVQRPSLGWCNIHSCHRLMEAYYYYSTCLIEGIGHSGELSSNLRLLKKNTVTTTFVILFSFL